MSVALILPLRVGTYLRLGVVGLRIVNLSTWKMGGKQPLDPPAILLVVHYRVGLRALHDAGRQETHGNRG